MLDAARALSHQGYERLPDALNGMFLRHFAIAPVLLITACAGRSLNVGEESSPGRPSEAIGPAGTCVPPTPPSADFCKDGTRVTGRDSATGCPTLTCVAKVGTCVPLTPPSADFCKDGTRVTGSDSETGCPTLTCVPKVLPDFCKGGTIESEAAYVASTDGKECSRPRVHCVTKNGDACPVRSPLPPDFCKDGTVENSRSYIPSGDGKECSISNAHCVTKSRDGCPMLTPRPPTFCSDGTIESGRNYVPSSDGKECSIPNVHCLTNDASACPTP